MWTQRDQFSKTKIPLGDYDLISLSPNLPKANHPSSKYLLAQVASSPSIAVGYLVYLYCDRNKSRGRDRYSMLPSIRTVPVSGHLKHKLNF